MMNIQYNISKVNKHEKKDLGTDQERCILIQAAIRRELTTDLNWNAPEPFHCSPSLLRDELPTQWSSAKESSFLPTEQTTDFPGVFLIQDNIEESKSFNIIFAVNRTSHWIMINLVGQEQLFWNIGKVTLYRAPSRSQMAPSL